MAKKPASLLKPDDYEWTWADFDDWNVGDEDDTWAIREYGHVGFHTQKQKEIIKRNIALLLDRRSWLQKTKAFAHLIDSIEEKHEQETKRHEHNVHFDCSVIEVNLSLSDLVIPCSIFFNEVSFKGEVDFVATNFKGEAVFKSAKFIKEVGCQRAIFGRDVSFDDANFESYADFERTSFLGVASFTGAEFDRYSVFSDALFEEDAFFEESVFKGDAFIDQAVFEGEAYFDRAKFEASFWLGGTDFRFVSAADLSVKTLLNINSYIEIANFSRLRVEGVTNLSGSEFKIVPDFTDSKLDRPPEVAGMIVPPPIMNPFRWFKFTKSKDEEDVAKYRKLKAMALAANDHEKDGEFFAYEMMAKRGHETKGFFPLLLNSLYWLLSFYGQSVARPFWAMIVSFFAFWAVCLAMIKHMTGSLQEFWFAGVHSALNLVPLIGTLFRTTSVPEGHISWYDDTYHQLVDNGLSPDWWAAFSALQQFIGAVLFFLLFLGLRNKFRLK